MADQAPAHTTSAHAAESHGSGNRLGSFLCWAVVFADIGTSVYYTPGILYGHYGTLAGLFVVLTLSVFILLTLKYAEVTQRFPEGGGVVTVASRAFGPWIGALGGMLILVDYFLTAALSSLSGLTYFAVVAPAIKNEVLVLTMLAIAFLGLLNWWGIKESATVSAVIAFLAFVGEFVVVVLVFTHVPLAQIGQIFTRMFATRQLTVATFIGGFAGAFLAFSGLESISQLSPVMRVPRSRVAGWALALVVVTVGLTSPLLTVFSTTLLCAHGVMDSKGILDCVNAAGQALDPNQFISLLGGKYGGPWIGGAVAVSAAALLIFASNTAIIGSYHVFLALTRMQFFPKPLIAINKFRGTPHWAIAVATFIPIAVLAGVNGQIDLLGDLYAFGLLGAFTVTCLGIDVVRWREHRGLERFGPTPAQEDAELHAQSAMDASRPPGRLASRLGMPELARRITPAWGAVAHEARSFGAAAQNWPLWLPLTRLRWRYGWHIKFALGILTTILIGFAWCVNLVDKELATIFGGGVTLLGLGIAFVYQITKALPTVFPRTAYAAMPNAWLVVLPVGATTQVGEQRAAVVRAAARGADGRPLVFLYVQPHRDTFTPSLFEITEPYLRDQDAQNAFSRAAVTAEREGVPYRSQRFIYRIGGDHQLVDVWRSLRPEESVAQAGSGFGRLIRADYVRQDEEEAGVKFYGHRGGINAPVDGDGRAVRIEEGASVAVVGLPAYLHRLISGWLLAFWTAVLNLVTHNTQKPEDTTASEDEEATDEAIRDESPAGDEISEEPEVRIHRSHGTSQRQTPPIAPGGSSGRIPTPPPNPKASEGTPTNGGDRPSSGINRAGNGPSDPSSPTRRTRQPSRPLR